MECNFAVKVSMLIDGELSAEESEKVREHISTCAECQNLEKDFLFFREQLKEPFELFEMPVFPAERQIPFWKRGISLPVPVFAVFVLALIGLSLWLIVSRFERSGNITAENPPKNSSANPENPEKEISLARFDKGGRAEIYVVPQSEKPETK